MMLYLRLRYAPFVKVSFKRMSTEVSRETATWLNSKSSWKRQTTAVPFSRDNAKIDSTCSSSA